MSGVIMAPILHFPLAVSLLVKQEVALTKLLSKQALVSVPWRLGFRIAEEKLDIWFQNLMQRFKDERQSTDTSSRHGFDISQKHSSQ